MSSELEALAARGKAAQQAHSKRRAQKKKRKQKREPPKRQLSKTAKISLQHPHFAGILFAFSLISLAPAGVVYLLGLPKMTYIAVLGGCFAFMLLGVFVITMTLRNLELDWLRSMPFAFDMRAYLKLLEREEKRGTLVVRVSFEGAVPADARETVSSAAFACGADEASFDGDELVVSSISLKTYYPSSPGSDRESYYSNRELHQFLRGLVDEGLVVIDSSYPIAEIEATTKGR